MLNLPFAVWDPAVWNLLQAEGRLRSDLDSLDIHIHSRIPEADPDLLQKSCFHLDGMFLQAIEEPVLHVATPLDEYYLGESIPWIRAGPSATNVVKLQLLTGKKTVAEEQPSTPRVKGAFQTLGLNLGICTLRATHTLPDAQPSQTSQQQIILAPNPFNW